MDKVLVVVKYKLKILLSDWVFLTAMVIIPIILTFITGFALRYEMENQVPVAICDLDNSAYSASIIESIQEKEGFRFILTDEKTAIGLVRDYKAEAAYIIKKGFMENLLAGNNTRLIEVITSPQSISTDVLAEIFGGEISRIMLNIAAADWVKTEYKRIFPQNSHESQEAFWQEAFDFTDSLWVTGGQTNAVFEELDSGVLTDTPLKPASPVSTAALGMLTAFIMFFIMFNSSWLVEERENGTLSRIISGPGAIGAMFAGNILSLFIAGLIQVFLFSAVTSFIFKINLFSTPSSFAILFIYLMAVISISLAASSVLKTRIQLEAAAPMFSIITGFLGGCFFDFSSLNVKLKTISLFTPQGVALDLFSKGGDLKQSLIIILLSLCLFVFSYFKIKNTRYG